VTTKFFGGKRAKSPKSEERKPEPIPRELSEETEEKKDETSEIKPTENADATAQTSEQAAEQTVEQPAEQTPVPESSTETENKKKEKTGIFSSFARRKSGSGNKKENSESQENAETEGEAVTSATDATDVDESKETDKVEKSGQKPVFPDEKRTKKSGNLLKQNRFIRSLEQRYFVLTNDKKLYYYRSNSDASSQKSIDVSKVKIVEDGQKFDLETRSRSYKLTAESKEERESWIQAFKELEFPIESLDSTSENREVSKKLDDVVPSNSGNENDIQKSVENAADKAADTADAKVFEAQETTTQSAKVVETTEEITITTETIKEETSA